MLQHDIKLEEIGGTSIEPTGGFSHVDILIAPTRYFTSIAGLLPIEGDAPLVLAASAKEAGEITADHTFNVGYGFAKFKAVQDKNGLESAMLGEKGGKVFENKLTVIVRGTDSETIGALRLLKNEQLIILAREAGTGRYRQLGHSRFAAELSEATPKIAPEYEGENGVTFVFSDKNVVAAPIYTGAITMQPAA